MSKPDHSLADQLAARIRARAEFNRQLARAKVDLAPSELKRRAVAEAQRTSRAVAHQAIDIANDSRGVVAATTGALVLWLARKPIMAGASGLFNRYQTRRARSRTVGGRIKLQASEYWRRLKEYADE